ncbi:MAG TPA: hypothetical protein H9796_10485, partial [Candidatus Butyricimonas faecavium]|nr:hypothetical protein [Candidatus Butyricimonas faecavium]
MTTVNYPTAINSGEFPYPFTLNNPEILFFYASSDEHEIVTSDYYAKCFMASDELRNCYSNEDQRWNGYLCPYSGDEKKSSKFTNELKFGA